MGYMDDWDPLTDPVLHYQTPANIKKGREKAELALAAFRKANPVASPQDLFRVVLSTGWDPTRLSLKETPFEAFERVFLKTR